MDTENGSGLSKLAAKAASIKSEDSLDREADKELETEAAKSAASLRELRETYANRLFYFLIAYCSLSYVLLVLHGFKVCEFQLEQSVLVVVVGSTAASALALVGIVAKGLFK